MNDEILKEQIEIAINNTNAMNENNIKEINGLIEEIDDENLKNELSILFTLKQVELSNQKDKKDIVRKQVPNKNKKIDVKVLIFAGAIGLGSIIGGIKLANRDNNKDNISTSYGQLDKSKNLDDVNKYDYYGLIPYDKDNQTIVKYDTFDAQIESPWSDRTGYYNSADHLEDEGYFGPEGYQKNYPGGIEQYKEDFFVNSTDAIDFYSCPKNLIYDYVETCLEWKERYIDAKEIEFQDLHYYLTDEELQARNDEYNSKSPIEAAQLLNNNCDTYYNLYSYISNQLSKNDKNLDYLISPFEEWAYNRNEYLGKHVLELLSIQKMYNKYLEVKVLPYMEKNNCSLKEAKDAIKEEFKKGDPRDGSLIYISESQYQRYNDFLFTLFVKYIENVGIDQFKEDYYFLFDEQYISENNKTLTK